jgi:hypothetical protein
MSISFNQLNGPDVSDGRGNTTLGTLSSQGADGQRGLNNTAVGFGALRTNNSSVQHNTAIGLNALSNNAGSDNVAIGENALYNYLTPTVAQTGNYNVAVGNNAIQYNTIGYQNVALGNQALNNNTTGYLNVAIGNNAMEGTGTTNETGSYNVAIGNQALNNNISGSDNAVVGNAAGYFNTTGKNNAALGANALLNNTTGNQNVAIGKDALQSSQTTTGNVAVGHHALRNHITGSGNIGIGRHALNANTTGSNNVGIGSGVSSNGNDSCILLGNGAQTVVSNEIGIGGINLAAPPSPAPSITGYLPVRMNNSTLSNKLYYVPMYDPSVPLTLPIPEVIIANHSSIGSSASGGVGLLIGFPSDYSAASSVTIANGAYSIVISPISISGYYVYYEDPDSGFWNNLSTSTYSNLVQVPTFDASLCSGLALGHTLTFTYVLSGVSTTVTYQPTSMDDESDGYQYEKYFGSGSPQNSAIGFQWGRNPGGGGSQSWGTQTGSGTQTYSAWTSSGDYQYNSIYKYLYPYSTVSGPGPSPGPGPSASMTWPVAKSLSSIASGATYTIGGTGSTDIPVPTTTGVVTGAIVYSISCDSNMPSITLSGSTLTVVWDAWSTSVSTGLSTNAYIIATATVQGTLTSAYLTTVLTVGSNNTITWTINPYTSTSAPTLYTIPAALTFSAQPPYYTNTPAFTVTNTYTNVAITSSVTSVATATNDGTIITTIAPSNAGSTIITAMSFAGTGKTRTLLTIAAPPSSGVTLLYSQVANMVLSSNLSISPSASSQQFVANQQGSDEVSGIIDYFLMPLITFINVPHTSNISFEMTLAKNGTTLVTTTFTLPGDAGTKYPNGINIPFVSPSAASNNPPINFTISPTDANTTITNLDQITISLKPLSIIQTGNWQINVIGSEMAGKVYGISQSPIIRTVPTFTFTPSLSTIFADVVYTAGLMIPFTLASNSPGTITHTMSSIPSEVATISQVGSATTGDGNVGVPSYQVLVYKPGTATITFTQAASGSFAGKIVTATLNVLNAPTITFTSVVNSQMTYAIGGKPPIVLNNAQTPAATSTNTNVPITYSLTGVSNIAGTTNPCATITTSGSIQTLTLNGFGSFTLVASQVASTTHGASTASIVITIVPGDGPSNPIVLNAIKANTSTTPFELNLNVNASISASMSYITNINAVVTHFNIPYFKVDTNRASQTVQFSLKVLSGGGGIPNKVESTTIFSITTSASGTYTSPTGGITVPLSNITPQPSIGITVVSQTPATSYAILNPPTPFSISTINPAIMVELAPMTVITYGSFTLNVNTNNPSGMLGTLYGHIQLLGPNLIFSPIITPITWTATKQIPFSPATSNATDSSLLTYSSSNTNVATIPTSTVNSMTLSATPPTTPTNVITISATRAATAIYSLQTVSINPTTNPNMPICINTYAPTSSQKIVYYNPQTSTSQKIPTIAANSQNFLITFNVTEQITLNSLNFVINGGEYGCTPAANFTLSILKTNGSVNSVISQIFFSTIKANYNSSDDGTLREIPFGPLTNCPTYVQNFIINGTNNPSFDPGDTVTITLSCSQQSYLMTAYDMNQFTGTVVGTSLVTSLPKILYMTSSDNMIITTNVSSNTVSIFKQCIITSFNVAGVKPGASTQTFTLTISGMSGINATNSQATPYSLVFTFTYAFDDISTFTSFQIPFSYAEYSRLYPSPSSGSPAPKMTAYSIGIVNNLLYSPTPPMFTINQTFNCVLASSSNFNVSTLGILMSGTIYGYEIRANPNLGALTLKTPLNNSNIIITQPSTVNSAPTFTYTVTSPATISNSNILTLTGGNYATVTITATMSETNQYNNAAVNETVDVIARTQLPPSTYSMTTILQAAGGAQPHNNTGTAYQYANVFIYGTSTPMPVPTLYGYGFFNIGPNDSNWYSGSNILFTIFKYQSGTASWTVLRTITIVYKQVANSNDDGSLFIIPFYDMFANGAAYNLPFTRLPSNIASLSVVCSDGTNNKVPPTFNLGDTLQFSFGASSPAASGQAPIDYYGQLAGTVLSTIQSSFDYVIQINPSSYSSQTWTSTGFTSGTQISSTAFTLPQPTANLPNAILTGIYLYPIQGVLINTQFEFNLGVAFPGQSGTYYYMTILGKTTIDEAFSQNCNIWFTNPFANRPNFTITNISINSTIGSIPFINKGLTGAQAVTTNPWIGAGASVWFTMKLTTQQQNPPSSYTTLMSNGNAPGVFNGCWC